MDTYERAVLKWLRDQPTAVTVTEINGHFRTMNFATMQRVLKSLVSQNKVEHGPPKGFMETWQVRSGG